MMQQSTSAPQNESNEASWKEPSDDRRCHCRDRRQTKCEGFTYIPMVGWYCRRDHLRRNEDAEDKESK